MQQGARTGAAEVLTANLSASLTENHPSLLLEILQSEEKECGVPAKTVISLLN
jgi:hypothetical protein